MELLSERFVLQELRSFIFYLFFSWKGEAIPIQGTNGANFFLWNYFTSIIYGRTTSFFFFCFFLLQVVWWIRVRKRFESSTIESDVSRLDRIFREMGKLATWTTIDRQTCRLFTLYQCSRWHPSLDWRNFSVSDPSRGRLDWFASLSRTWSYIH